MKLIQTAVSGRAKHCLVGLLVLCSAFNASADATWVYAVQISAVVQISPPQIVLNWEPDEYGANTYTVYRKSKTDTNWGSGVTLPGSATSFTDANVSLGSAYEYQVSKAASLGYSGYGYIYVGINAPLTENRGKVILVVATESVTGLSSELARLQTDLIGDGWQVIRHDISTNDTPATVRSLIINDYSADPTNVNTVFLLGHVPILQSGYLNYDTHQYRPMPADAYYGDVTGDWSSSPSYLPADVTLMVGRVDLYNMPGAGAPTPWPSEAELLRQYLNKDHNWRHKILTAQRRALIGDLRGPEQDQIATAASAYRNFEPFVGPGNIYQSGVTNGTPDDQRWISLLTADTYTWAFACGAGQPTAISGMGLSDGTFYDVRSTDIVAQDAKAVFLLAYGSWFGNWDDTDDILRSILATPTYGLAACMSGEPHWFLQHLALGETLGYSTRLTINNTTLYQTQNNTYTRAIYIALMGDPTLRTDQVAPPSGLDATTGPNTAYLSWTASPDPILGYHLYRSTSTNAPFTRITPNLLTTTTFTDANLPAGTYTYIVRAVKLENYFSGSYYNPSQGILTTITLPAAPPTITLTAAKNGTSLLLTWNSQPETTYHIQATTDPSTNSWANISPTILSTGTTTTWTDTNLPSIPKRFYRISTP